MSLERFRDLTFEGFRELARDGSLSAHEKVGFPNSYREGKEPAILADIRAKLSNLETSGGLILDVGPGCSGVARGLIELCGERGHSLFLIDSAEMLRLLPNPPCVTKVPGRFPDDCAAFLHQHRGRLDAILVYSVIQYVAREASAEEFLDRCLELLAAGGQLLIGDVPNRSMRERFLGSAAGREFVRGFAGEAKGPPAPASENLAIDDAAMLALIERARRAGYDAFLLPQAPGLPMAGRREDLLIRKP
jgi:hypothetical protein